MRKAVLLTLSLIVVLFSSQAQKITVDGVPGACSANAKKTPVPLAG
jgi:hypothetical protein